MRHTVLIVMLTVMMAMASAVRAATPAQVDTAIEKAKAYLYKKQAADGTWEIAPKPRTGAGVGANDHDGPQWGGMTSLAVYALLACGESPRDPKLVRAVEFMKKADLVGTYAIAMRIMACSFLPETQDIKMLMRQDQARLLKLMETQGNARGMYDYYDRPTPPGKKPPKPDYSHSRSQYGVLGIWVATQAGIETPGDYWKTVEQGWIRNQDNSGGWTYKFPSETKVPVTPGMTAAGVASLFITQDYTLPAGELKGNVRSVPIERGLNYLAQNVSKFATSQSYERAFTYVTMYAVERVGVASGVKYLGTVDWFDKGAEFLVKAQRSDGSWMEGPPFTGPVGDTCFALLFLARGRAPVVMQKLQYDISDEKGKSKEGNWNQRPRDVANIVRHFGREVEKDVNWQIANLRAPLEDLFDAPILYITGNQAISFSAEDKAKLKAYVEGGGLIVGHSEGPSEAFSESFRKLGTGLFDGREFRDLPRTHISMALLDKNATAIPRTQGLTNGSRELMILLASGDPARGWQAQSFKADRAAAAALMRGIILYTCEKKNLRVKGADVLIAANKTPAEKTAKVARLDYGANADPEPGAWPRLGRYLHNTTKTDIAVKTIKLGEGNLTGVKLAHLTGTNAFRLEKPALDEIRSFIKTGGTLLIEACGGSREFAVSATEMIKEMYPQAVANVLPADHPLLAGLKSDDLRLRTFGWKTLKSASGSRLRGIEIDGRLAILVSEEDLSGGWVGHQFDGIIGYDGDAALRLGAAIVKFTAK